MSTLRTSCIFLSLFDRVLDHISAKPTPTEVAKWRPSTCALVSKTLPVIDKYILIAERRQQNIASRIQPIIQDYICSSIRARITNAATANEIIARHLKAVDVKPVEYGNIWDIGCCKEAIAPVIDEITKEEPPLTLIINLLGGTSAAKTALYLVAKRIAQSRKNIKLCIVKPLGSQDSATSQQFWFGADTSTDSTGLLRQGVGAMHQKYAFDLNRLEYVIQSDPKAKILITGPTGVGKSELAKLIIEYMKALHPEMDGGKCVMQNVAAISPNLIESELFGHEEGAFTGAAKQHKGIFERSDGGVVFLDEIAELPKHLQAKLLTILDGAPFTRVGGEEPVSSKFMLICGTNKDLQRECSVGNFREDLFERLNTWHIDIPALKDRPEDIEGALQREQGRWQAAHGHEAQFAAGAKAVFLAAAKRCLWPGNFREFHATFVHLALYSHLRPISAQSITDEFSGKDLRTDGHVPASEANSSIDNATSSASSFDLVSVASLACALDVCRKCKTAKEAGEILFAARLASAQRKGTEFNGAASIQRLFSQYGLKVQFKHGEFHITKLPN